MGLSSKLGIPWFETVPPLHLLTVLSVREFVVNALVSVVSHIDKI